MELVNKSWYQRIRDNATITKEVKDHIIHYVVKDTNTGEIRYERWEVRYTTSILKTDLRFKTLEEAQAYNEKCKEYIRKQRLEFGKKPKIDVLEYPENLLKQIGLTYDTPNIDFNEVLRRFDDNFSKVSVILLPREKQILNERFNEFKTLEEIGKDLHITRERVRQLEYRALKKLEKKTDIFLNRETKYDLIATQEYIDIKEKMTYEIALQVIREYESKHKVERELFDSEIDNLSIDNVCENVRQHHCLTRNNIKTIGDLKKHSVEDLMKIRNLGRKSLTLLLRELKNKYNIELKTDFYEED